MVVTADSISVLHVDDEPGFAEMAAEMLERADDRLCVETATSPAGALDTLESGRPDCVVSDYQMPDIDGIGLLEAVRERWPELPFVLFTGKGSEEIASEAISAGVDDYLQKEQGTEQYTVLANRIRNLVDRELAEAAARDADRRYHNLIDTAPVPIVLFDQSAEVRYANDAALDMLGTTDRRDLDGVRMPDLVAPEDRQRALDRFERIFEEHEPAPETEFRIEALDGTRKRLIVATAHGVYHGEPVAQAIARQIDPVAE